MTQVTGFRTLEEIIEMRDKHQFHLSFETRSEAMDFAHHLEEMFHSGVNRAIDINCIDIISDSAHYWTVFWRDEANEADNDCMCL